MMSLLAAPVGAARLVLDRTVEVAEFAVSVPGRVVNLLETTEALVGRIDGVVTEAREIVARIDDVVTDARATVGRVGEVVDSSSAVVGEAATVAHRAQDVVASAGRTSDSAGELLDTYAPMATRAAPLAGQFIDELSAEEVHAAVVLLDQLPELADRMTALMPILGTLETVAPEIHELLGVAKDVRQAIVGVPGFNFLRRRGEDKENDDDD
ncbi:MULTISPECIES: ribulose 1,5-bisphosphate carboxylase large subunit [Rhodococcus]|uniref:ribulose 1,5-bisphosphate carboxylase large subunit n=1 Tax=Rhodococcus TaxID=1827 RepID=UPI00163B25DC|nr:MULTISPECIES: ribulose 1,5-bisphosphate carboxylase large subunit [Rhodococcus]MBC2589675.1 ribulose 1,5-bisphosphate carboxylase large subunit [Rhodococcus aetherivorans]QRI77346.1 ribulose 1,5-bisphosphate carboxylase large subunit [Rhodococcus aetherivorans]QSE60766.1 ribulose 1,5-bisphosphate carboxylase large subunit [Rhodococcus sp. PSBB066]QSE67926.1 ribulose 1,5-bisphosphate carboxylase large subunit [Rhodococcus sp. PSBB049]